MGYRDQSICMHIFRTIIANCMPISFFWVSQKMYLSRIFYVFATYYIDILKYCALALNNQKGY